MQESNQTHNDPREKCIHHLFEEQVQRTGDQIAVVYLEQHLTFRELNHKANQLARYIQQTYATQAHRPLQPDTLIAICVERSLEMIIGILAILKAGAAYVPIDPSYPQERIHYILRDTQTPLVLTQRHLINFFTDSLMLIALDDEDYLQEANMNLSTSSAAHDLAYVMYTSGTTGNPKGVLVEHSGVVSFCSNDKLINIQETTAIAALSNYAFDGSIFDLFFSLLNGITVIIVSKEASLDATELQKVLLKYSIDALFVTTALFNNFSRQDHNPLLTVKHVLFGGEQSNTECIKEFIKHNKGSRLTNVYGPTETIVFATQFEIKQGMDYKSFPIGKELNNKKLYILDNHMTPVPIGVVGELYIGGSELARGYHRQPQLTQERFISNPFADADQKNEHDRLYKTGDLCRWLFDGMIEYIGRIDHQVKIRGFRIELEEIEACLSALGNVKETVVIAREHDTGDKQLVAYVVPKNPREIPNSEQWVSQLRKHLELKLPDYMIPTVIIVIEKLPLSPNGKLDRKALPAPEDHYHHHEYRVPRNEIENTVREIWAEILHLNVDQIGIEDNFFELGGHSLSATLVVSRLRKNFHIELPLNIFFKHPSILEVCKIIINSKRNLTSPIIPIARDRYMPLSFAQQGYFEWLPLITNPEVYNISAAISLRGALDITSLERAFNAIISRHEILRTRICKIDGQYAQRIESPGDQPLLLTDLSTFSLSERKNKIQQVIEEEANNPFDFLEGKLFRIRLCKLSHEEYLLLITLHHSIADGWSCGILMKEISTYYNAFIENKIPLLPDLPIQYVDYAVWQKEYVTKNLKRLLKYWRNQLAGLPLVIHWPPKNQASDNRSSFRLTVDECLCRQLIKLSQDQCCTLFMLLLTTFFILLYSITEQEDLAVETPTAYRVNKELENSIGCFATVIVLRAHIYPKSLFRNLLKQIKQCTQDAYTYQDLPYEVLLDNLVPDEQQISPVLFALQNLPYEDRLVLKNMQTKNLSVDKKITDYDLEFAITPIENILEIAIVYRVELFDRVTIEQMANKYLQLLKKIVANPNQSIKHLHNKQE